MLYPLLDHADLVEGVGALSAGAMPHARHHKQTNPIRGTGGVPA
jgi:hypothetical protein